MSNSKFNDFISSFIKRIANMLSNPKEEWLVVESEKPSQIQLFIYAFILATIPFFALFIKYGFIGDAGDPEGDPLKGLIYGSYYSLSSIFLVYIIAWFVDLRALSNNSNKDFGRSLQLVIYSFTPYWLAGVLYFLGLNLQAIVQVVGFYSIYLIYLGLKPIKHTQDDKIISYMINIVIAVLVLRFLVGALSAYIL